MIVSATKAYANFASKKEAWIGLAGLCFAVLALDLNGVRTGFVEGFNEPGETAEVVEPEPGLNDSFK